MWFMPSSVAWRRARAFFTPLIRIRTYKGKHKVFPNRKQKTWPVCCYLACKLRTKHFPESKNTSRIQKYFPRIQNISQNPKHFPKFKTLPRIQTTSQNPKILPQNPKHIPESKNTSQNPKQVTQHQNTLGFLDVFWILGSVLDSGTCFGFLDVFWILGCVLDSETCFWILGCVLDSGTCFWILGRVLDSGMCFGFWDVFWILGRVFGFWDVFWILGSVLDSGSVLSLWAIVCSGSFFTPPPEPPGELACRLVKLTLSFRRIVTPAPWNKNPRSFQVYHHNFQENSIIKLSWNMYFHTCTMILS